MALLRRCLESLHALMHNNEIEIIVVDNGSTDNTVPFLKETYPDVLCLPLSSNKGVAYARNRGLEKARGEYLFILDNDTIVNTEAITGMKDYMDNHPETGLCGCRLVDVNGLVQESCKRYPGIFEKAANVLSKGFRYAYGEKTMQRPFEPVYLIGACQFFRKKVYEQVGPLDEKIFYGPEDADFCIRIRKKGWKIMYLPQFTIIHFCQRTTNKKIFSKLARKHIAGLFHFYWKHKKFF